MLEGVQQVFWGDPEFLYNFQYAYGLIGPLATPAAQAQMGMKPWKVSTTLEDKTSPQVRGLVNKFIQDDWDLHGVSEPVFAGYGYFEKEDTVKFLMELPPLDDFQTRKSLLDFLKDPQLAEMVGEEGVTNFCQLLLPSD